MEKFNPSIIVHNGEGLTLTIRPDNKIFKDTKDDSNYEFKFNDMDVDNNNEVKYVQLEDGLQQIRDDVFLGIKPPILTKPIDGETNWNGEVSYTIDDIGVSNNGATFQCSTDSSFQTDVLEIQVSSNTSSGNFDIGDVLKRYGLDSYVYVRVVANLVNGVRYQSSPVKVRTYSGNGSTVSFSKDIPSDGIYNGRIWDGVINYTTNIRQDLKDFFNVKLTVGGGKLETINLDIKQSSYNYNFKTNADSLGLRNRLTYTLELYNNKGQLVYRSITQTCNFDFIPKSIPSIPSLPSRDWDGSFSYNFGLVPGTEDLFTATLDISGNFSGVYDITSVITRGVVHLPLLDIGKATYFNINATMFIRLKFKGSQVLYVSGQLNYDFNISINGVRPIAATTSRWDWEGDIVFNLTGDKSVNKLFDADVQTDINSYDGQYNTKDNKTLNNLILGENSIQTDYFAYMKESGLDCYFTPSIFLKYNGKTIKSLSLNKYRVNLVPSPRINSSSASASGFSLVDVSFNIQPCFPSFYSKSSGIISRCYLSATTFKTVTSTVGATSTSGKLYNVPVANASGIRYPSNLTVEYYHGTTLKSVVSPTHRFLSP